MPARKKKKKNVGGGPRIKIEQDDVVELAAVGCSAEEIARMVTQDDYWKKHGPIHHRANHREPSDASSQTRACADGRSAPLSTVLSRNGW